MKKKIGIILALILCFSLFAVSAAAQTVYEITTELEGSGSVYSGDRHEVTFYVDSEALALDGKLEFDENQVKLVEFIPLAGDTWTVSYNESTSRFFATDAADFNHPLVGKQAVFKAVFEVAELEVGTSIHIACTDVRVATAKEEIAASDDLYTAAVIAGKPTSSDCTLKDISVAGGSLSPAFTSDATSYVVYLPNEITAANITALANDRLATVAVDGPEALKAETYNEYKITCTAENGAQKVYTLLIWRAPVELLHEHSYGMEVVEPTCSAAGYTSYVCTCGHSYQSDVKDPTGHSFGQWETTQEATVKAEGEQLRKCTCGAEETRPIAKVSKNADTGKVVLTIVLIIVGVLVGCGIIAGVLYYLNIKRTGKFLQKKKKEEE